MKISTASSRPFGHLLHVVLAIAGYATVTLFVHRLIETEFTPISPLALQNLLSTIFLTLAALAIALILAGQAERYAGLVTAVFLLGWLLVPIWAFGIAPWLGAPDNDRARLGHRLLFEIPSLLFVFWFLSRQGIVAVKAATIALFYTAAIALQLQYLPSDFLSFHLKDKPAPDVRPVDVEALYLAQPDLMLAELSALPPQDPTRAEVFGLVLGGTSHQSVFLSEAEKGAAVLEKIYAANGHFIRLANSDVAPRKRPLANRSNLAAALAKLGQHVGAEDLVFVYLLSHGKKDLLSLSFPEAGTTDLTASELAKMLDSAGIGPAVIVMSACYSGSFLDDLATRDRLVLTAAAADRASFGCRDGNEWSDFGQAFLSEMLPRHPDPRIAFEQAKIVIQARERAQDLPHSLPQRHEGEAIGPVIDRVLEALSQPNP